MKDQIADIVSAIKEEGITALSESIFLKDLVANASQQLISGPAAPIVGSILGAAAPRINGVILAYRQNRFERNMTRIMTELTKRVSDLENNYSQLSAEKQEQYQQLFVEMLLDSVVEERQEEKIKWGVNGFVNLMTSESNENIMQLFFDTLTDLTTLDVDTLKMYYAFSDINWKDIETKYGIDADRFKLVKEKLVRLGLLYRKSDQQRDVNIDEIVDYFIKVESDSKKRNPKGIKPPNKLKKISINESYGITLLGGAFLKSIGEG